MTVAKDKLYDITFILHDLTHKPIANLYYEIKNHQDMVKKGMTNAQGEISLKYVGGNTLTIFVRKAHDQKMKKIGEIHTPNKNIKVKMISPKMKFDVTLLPQGNQGKYWRGTYKVKKGDTLSKIAKEHHTTVSALLALNPSIKSPNQIYQNQAIELGESNDNAVLKLDEHSVIKVPPAKKTTGHVISDRKSTGGSSSSTTATPQAKQKTSTTQVEHKSASPQVQPSPTPSKSVIQKTPQPTTAKKTSTVATTTTTPQKIAVQQEHNENKKPVAVASLSGCVCKQYDIAWGKAVNCTFRKKVIQICKDMWPNDVKNMANNLMACMHLETGGTFDPKAGSKTIHVGLIQFGDDVMNDLTTTKAEMLKKTATEQLDLVKTHFMKNDYHKKMKSLTDMYLYINYPKALLTGKNNPNDVLYEDRGKISGNPYISNPAFMKEKGEYNNIYDYKKNADGTYKLNKHGEKIPIRGFHGGKTYIWEVTQEIDTHLNNGILKDNREVSFSCSIKNENTVPVVSESIAPWMKIAIREAKQWKGKKEGEIQKVDNYHTMVKSGYKTMVGDKNPWCASFVNYCLKETNYKMSKALASSQSFKWDSSFVKISKPAYGAIAVWTSEEDKRYGHVCFVLGISGTANFIRLGGNQGDMITVDSRSITTYKYYLPKKYYEEIHGVINIASEENLKNLKEQGFPVYDSNATR